MSKTAIAFRRLKTLGQMRDVLLVSGSAVYISGYLVWALVAWRRQLGTLPVLDAQYFVAGLPPLAALVLALVVALSLGKFVVPLWRTWVKARKPHHQLIVRLGLGSAALLAFAIPWVTTKISPDRTALAFGVFAVIMWLSTVLAAEAPLSPLVLSLITQFDQSGQAASLVVSQPFSKVIALVGYVDRLNQLVMVYVVPPLVAIGFASIFVSDLYPRIPQELGGGKPRCATVDFEPSQVSAEALSELVGATLPTDTPNRVVRSRPMNVHFVTNDVIIASVPSKPLERRIDIPRDVVRLIRWCDAG